MIGVTSNLYESKEYSDIREVIKDGINRYPDCVAFTIKNKEGKDSPESAKEIYERNLERCKNLK